LKNWSSLWRQIIAAALGTLCVSMFAQLAILQWREVRFERALLGDIENSNARHRAAAKYLSLLRDVETGYRGFVVTGNADYLQPFQQGLGELQPISRQMTTFYTPGSRQSALVYELLRTGEAKVRYSQTVVALRQAAGQAQASALVGTGQGKRLMDYARRLTAVIERHERDETRIMLILSADQRSQQQGLIMVTEAALLAAALALVGMLLATIRRLHKYTQSLNDAGMRHAAIFDNATDAMMMLDGKGDIVSVNAAAERLFGRSQNDMLGRSNLMLFADPPSDEVSQAYLKSLARDDDFAEPSQDFVGRRGDGTPFETEVVTTPVRLHDRLHFLAVGRDTTERRRVERMKTDFVATVSHELRTPMTSITGSLGLLAGGAAGDLSDKARRLVDIALNNSQRLIRLINDILDIEKIESGKMRFDNRPLPLDAMLQQVIDANAGFAQKHRVQVRLDPIPSDAAIVADADRMVQVLTNLLSNAIKYSPAGETVILAVNRAGLLWRISVADCGPGIPDEFRTRIFGKFAQADGSDTRVFGGSGLGLSIVKEIVTRSGGEVSFTSRPGKGTVFHVDLPAVPTCAPDDDTAVAPQPLPDIGRAHILHVEDDPDTLRLVASAFEHKAEVHSTPSVREAEASLRRWRFDAILLDVAMHDGNGLELIPLIRRTSPQAPIILFTALDVGAADAAKVDAVVVKSRTLLVDFTEQVSQLMKQTGRKAA